MIEKALHELRYYGPGVVCKHVVSKLTKDDKDYILAMQKKAQSFSLGTIEELVSYDYYKCKGQKLNLQNPQTFDEKIKWLMLYDATPIKTRLVDKLLVRDYVKEKIGEEYLIPLIGAWDRFEDIDFSSLPQRFVLKLNNGSGMNIVVKDKSALDIADAKRKFDYWMKTNFAYVNFEMQYRDVPQKIIAEKYMEQMDGNLYDYKMHCFGGKLKICQLIGDRDLVRHTGREVLFDKNWNRLNETAGNYPYYETVPPKPENWKDLKQIAEKLAEGFNYVRIDLYSVEDKIYFGEYTFTPAAGCHPHFNPPSTDLEWGKQIELPQKYALDIPKR